MTVIKGLVCNSSGVPVVSGRFGVQLRQLLIDRSTTPDSVLTGDLQYYNITNGVLNSPILPGTVLGEINLLPTAALAVSYRFTIEKGLATTEWFLDSGETYPDDAPRVQNSGSWWTGSSFIAGESKKITPVVRYTYTPLIDPFDAIVPDVPTIELADLLQLASDFVSNVQAGLVYLAQMLTESPQYADKLRVGRWTGVYNPATTYFRGDVVSFGSPAQAWVWKLASAGSGVAPPASGQTGNANWDYFPGINVTAPAVDLNGYLLKAGGTMTGNLLLPAPGVNPPSTIAVRKGEADAQYARVGNPGAGVNNTFYGNQTINSTGSLAVPDQAVGNSSSNAANTKLVDDTVKGLMSPRLLVSAIGDATPPAIILGSPVTNVGVTNLSFENELYDPTNRYNLTDFTVPANGTYEFDLRLLIRFTNTTSSAGQDRFIARVYLFNFTSSAEIANFALLNLPLSAIQTTYMLAGRIEARDMTAGHVLVPRLAFNLNTASNAFTSSPVIDTTQGNAQNSFRAYRTTF
jgi:hypothetical protein